MKTKLLLLLLAVILAGCGEPSYTTTETFDKEGVIASLEIRGEHSVWTAKTHLFCITWADGSLSQYPISRFLKYKQLGVNQRKIRIYKREIMRSDFGSVWTTEYRWEYSE